MRFGKVIGSVVLNHAVPALQGARYIMVKPMSKAQFIDPSSDEYSAEPSLVVYDKLGSQVGDVIGFTEGGEAMYAFDEPTPVDAYNAILVDRITYSGT